jgi:tetratricopeptide (TPR) repeat protein
MGDDLFLLIYDESTRTAAETFRKRRGNCLSFTNLFVAMARNLGIDASYQEMEIPPDWSLAGESFLLSKHVNVYLQLRHDESRIVDFNIYDFSTTYEHHVIPDRRARAHYYNNIGAESMLHGETPGALANFKASLREDPTFSPAWINLGILYRREAYPAYAEAAFMQALTVEPFSLVAMSNLASLYEDQGRTDLAQTYRDRVEVHRMRNPYYRLFLAREAFASGDYDTSIEHLKHAIREREGEPRFYSLLSLSYLMEGNRHEAQRWMEKAEQAAVKKKEREKYSHKLEWLMKQSAQ